MRREPTSGDLPLVPEVTDAGVVDSPGCQRWRSSVSTIENHTA